MQVVHPWGMFTHDVVQFAPVPGIMMGSILR